MKNVFYSVIFTLSTGLLAFVVNRVFSEELGQESLGLLRLFTQMIAYLNLAELGLGAASTALLYKHINNNDNNAITNVFNSIKRIYFKIFLVILSLGILSVFFINDIAKYSSDDVYYIWLLYVISTAFTYLYAKYIILFTADQQYGFIQKVRNITKLIIQLIQLISLIYIKSFYVFVFLLIVGNIIEYVFYLTFYRKKYKQKIKNKKGLIDVDLLLKTKMTFIHKISGVFVLNTDYILMATFLNLKIVAIYSSYLMIIQFVNLFISNALLVIKPIFGKYLHSHDIKFVHNKFNELSIFISLMASVVVTFLFNSISIIVLLWMGDGYLINMYTLILIFINVYIDIYRKSIDLIKDVSGYFNDIHLPILEGVSNLILSVVLCQLIGLNGIILGTVITNVVVVLLWKPYYIYKHVLHVSFKEYINKIFLSVFITLLSVTSIYYISSYINVDVFWKVLIILML
ncbi:lipopolysaccharide biosynthesis protein, partial [Photobacterium sp. GB-1]|uniref:lipopolysaccharide biosynthesis protein n=1 Tax=Photobacterium sp. GB-1 TaxID=2022111 RepID=UPI000D151020